MNDEKINILLCMNRGLFMQSFVLLNSIFSNNDPANVNIYLFETDIFESQKKELLDYCRLNNSNINIIHFDKAILSGFIPNGRITIESYLRLLAVDYLPYSLSRILYIDIDIVVNKSLERLYFTDFEDKAMCACQIPIVWEIFSKDFSDKMHNVYDEIIDKGGMYFNAGVLLINLDYMRENKYDFEFYKLKYIELCDKCKTNKPFQEDQGLLNYIFGNKVKPIDGYKYNCRPAYYSKYKDEEEFETIIHFTNDRGIQKPWVYKFDDSMHYTTTVDFEHEKIHRCHNLWWSYSEGTPYHQQMIKEAQIRTKEYLSFFPQLEKAKTISAVTNEKEKFKSYAFFYDKLISKIYERHDCVVDYFLRNNWKTVAVYGKTLISDKLRYLLQKSSVKVVYIVENNLQNEKIPVYRRDTTEFPICDVMIVTDMINDDKIQNKLQNIVSFKIISAKEMISKI